MYGLRPLRRSNELLVHGMPPSQTPGLHAQECIRVYLGPVEGPADLRLYRRRGTRRTNQSRKFIACPHKYQGKRCPRNRNEY
jgi:hypothetical protein